MRIRTALALGLVATAASGVFAAAPAEAVTDCVTNAPVTGCVHVEENGCVVYGSGRIGPNLAWVIPCLP